MYDVCVYMRVKFSAKIFLLLLLSAVMVGAAGAYLRPVPAVQATVEAKSLSENQSVSLPWPAYGQGAIGALGYGTLQEYGEQKPVPIASVAKIVTALAVLQKRPLDVGSKGPQITLGPADVNLYEDYFTRGGSVVKVANGEKITEYEALQAMLLPSGNNIADSLAIWAFGSLEAYAKYANQMVRQMGLKTTFVADASGFSPATVSTAQELVQIGQTVMANPVLSEIVGQKTAIVPIAGEIKNVNWLLGQEGVVGIKTGNISESGGCFLFATNRQISGHAVTVIGAILGAPTRTAAISDSRRLIQAVDSGFENKTYIQAGESVGQYSTPWGAMATVVARDNLSALIWKSSTATLKTNLRPTGTGIDKGWPAGTIELSVGKQRVSQKAVLGQPLAGPSWYWRITHGILN